MQIPKLFGASKHIMRAVHRFTTCNNRIMFMCRTMCEVDHSFMNTLPWQCIIYLQDGRKFLTNLSTSTELTRPRTLSITWMSNTGFSNLTSTAIQNPGQISTVCKQLQASDLSNKCAQLLLCRCLLVATFQSARNKVAKLLLRRAASHVTDHEPQHSRLVHIRAHTYQCWTAMQSKLMLNNSAINMNSTF